MYRGRKKEYNKVKDVDLEKIELHLKKVDELRINKRKNGDRVQR